ncbi:MAG: hypothetical protein ACD_63C00070G0007 [uncultured bacterium]|nr:MAG: hypothetical protein ACD_63C00070G0007 [uncultured bacterium]
MLKTKKIVFIILSIVVIAIFGYGLIYLWFQNIDLFLVIGTALGFVLPTILVSVFKKRYLSVYNEGFEKKEKRPRAFLKCIVFLVILVASVLVFNKLNEVFFLSFSLAAFMCIGVLTFFAAWRQKSKKYIAKNIKGGDS